MRHVSEKVKSVVRGVLYFSPVFPDTHHCQVAYPLASGHSKVLGRFVNLCCKLNLSHGAGEQECGEKRPATTEPLV